jgi:hypothetical protein
MNVKIGTETPIFLFWEHLFRNFGILSLQCWEQEVHKEGLNSSFTNFRIHCGGKI